MSSEISSYDSSSSDNFEEDPDFVPHRKNKSTIPEPLNKPVTRYQSRKQRRKSKSLDNLPISLDSDVNNPVLKSIKTMAKQEPIVLSFETALQLVPRFNGEDAQQVYPFIDTCDFVMNNVEESTRSILLRAILTKMTGKAFAIRQYREVTSWGMLKRLLEDAFCAKRTAGYLQLELTTCKMQIGENVQSYSSRIERLVHELCNVSAKGRSTADAKAVHDYIREITLTTYVEGLSLSIRSTIKSKNLSTLEDAINESIEEEKIYQSNKDTQRILQGRPYNNSSGKYCKNCKKSNHNTNECRYAKRDVEMSQQNKQLKDNNNKINCDSKRPICGYCRKNGHSIEECFKKKNADARRINHDNQNLPSTSGNDKESGKAGVRPIRELKLIAQDRKY